MSETSKRSTIYFDPQLHAALRLKGESGVSPEMSLRLSKVLGRSPES